MAIQQINLGTAPTGVGGDTNRSAYTKINQNFTDSANAASRLVGTAAGNVMEVGAFGLGLGAEFFMGDANAAQMLTASELSKAQFARFSNTPDVNYGTGILIPSLGDGVSFIVTGISDRKVYLVSVANKNQAPNNRTVIYDVFYTSSNTTKDSNGFIKAASPIVKLFADKIELNDEATQQKIIFEKLGIGDYLVKGSTGFAQEGWYIEMPKDANGNVLVAVVYEQLANNDISVKTYAKMFDPDTGDIVPNTARPRDIPTTRWIDLRLQALPQPDIKPFSTDETVNTNAE